MFNPARWYSATRTLLIVVILQGVVGACDATSPVGPDGLRVPDPAFAVVPSGLSASATSWNQIDLAWPQVKSASSYEIFRSTTGPAGSYSWLTSTAALSYSDAGLTGATQYCYRIRTLKYAGRNINVSAFSDPVCATTPPAPVIPAPSAFSVVPQSSWSVRMTWADNSPDEDGFFIERAPAMGGTWTTINTVSANATSHIQTVNPDEEGCFRVTAFIGARRSLPSPADCTAAPVWPSGLSATGTVDHTISLNWTDNSAVEDGYEVSRYNVGAVWSVVATLPANANSYVDNSAAVDVRYYYRVRAARDGGYGDYSNTAGAIAATVAPTAPSDVSAWFYYDEWSGEYYFYISWTPGSANEEGFRIKMPDGSGGWTTYSTAEAGSSYWWEYYNYYSPQSGCYQVVAFNSVGEANPVEACLAE